MHTDLSLPFTATDSPLIQCLIRRIKKFHGECDHKPRQPITLSVLTNILSHLNTEKAGYSTIYAACCITYAGLLCCREFTLKSAKSNFSPETQLSTASVKFFPSYEDAESVSIFIPASKTDPFRKGVTIQLASTPGKATCPVATLKQLFQGFHTADQEKPLFPAPDHPSKSLSQSFFISTICKALSNAGYDPSLFASHSFCQGGTSAAATAGCSDYEIQLLGCWHSDAYKLYIKVEPSRLLYISSSLHWAHSNHTSYIPLDL